jgi:hypothetical protein
VLRRCCKPHRVLSLQRRLHGNHHARSQHHGNPNINRNQPLRHDDDRARTHGVLRAERRRSPPCRIYGTEPVFPFCVYSHDLHKRSSLLFGLYGLSVSCFDLLQCARERRARRHRYGAQRRGNHHCSSERGVAECQFHLREFEFGGLFWPAGRGLSGIWHRSWERERPGQESVWAIIWRRSWRGSRYRRPAAKVVGKRAGCYTFVHMCVPVHKRVAAAWGALFAWHWSLGHLVTT